MRILFSSDLVPATLRVKSEPTDRRPRQLAQQILVEHGLTLEDGPRHTRLVVRGAGPEHNLVLLDGIVRHIGTQFETRVEAGEHRVRVREGTVAVERGDARWTSSAGERLVLRRHSSPLREPIATSGPEWAWVERLAEPFTLEGSAVPRLLDWASREMGVRWE